MMLLSASHTGLVGRIFLFAFILESVFVAASPGNNVHVLWIGDSLTRYGYIDYLYRFHRDNVGFRRFESARWSRLAPAPVVTLATLDDAGAEHNTGRSENNTPVQLLWERYWGNWTDYFRGSTATFEGHMTCECWREPRMRTESDDEADQRNKVWPPAYVRTVVENRHYDSARDLEGEKRKRDFLDSLLPESNSLHMSTRQEKHTFMQYLGDHAGVRGVRTQRKFPQNFGPLRTFPPEFAYQVSLKFALQYLYSDLDDADRISHIVLNVGWWKHTKLLVELEETIEAALKVAPIVIWSGTGPGRNGDDSQFRFIEEKMKKLSATSNGAVRHVPFPYRRQDIPDACFCDMVHYCCPEIYRKQTDLLSQNWKAVAAS